MNRFNDSKTWQTVTAEQVYVGNITTHGRVSSINRDDRGKIVLNHEGAKSLVLSPGHEIEVYK